MKKYFLIGSLLASVITFIPASSWSGVNKISTLKYQAIPNNVLKTANNWMAKNAIPYVRIHPTYTNLGKGVWEITWTWQVADGTVYESDLIINTKGQLLNAPVITVLGFWPY